MKAVTSTTELIKAILMYELIYVEKRSTLTEHYCVNWMHVEESNKSSKTKNQYKTFKAYKM